MNVMQDLPIRLGGCLVALAAMTVPGAVQAQDGFLFREPTLTLLARLGYAVPTASNGVLDFTTRQLTVEQHDFNAPFVGGSLGIRITPRLDLTVDGGWAGGTVQSEFREWVGEDDLPIEQITDFARWYVTGGARFYLTGRGRSVGSYAWVPSLLSPYLGFSAGWGAYRFEQDGEWVDYQTLDIFRERFVTRGETFTLQGAAGLDVSLSARLFLNGEVRYGWGSAGLSSDYEGFDGMNLSGVQFTAGLGVRL